MAENRELARCSVCKHEKSRTAFNLSLTTSKGITNRCRECGIAYMKIWRAKNNDHVRNYAIKYHEMNNAKRKELFKAWYVKNREENIRKVLSRRNANVELARLKCREWAARNVDRRRQYKKDNRILYRSLWQRRRAREREAEGCWTKKDIEALFIQQECLCAYCSAVLGKDFQVDHVIPLAKGGSNWPNNLALACPHCNRTKSARLDMKPTLRVING